MIRVLIVDDHAIVREGIRTLLQKLPDIEVVAEAEDGRAALQRVADTAPDVVIMDMAMSGMNGVDATERITADYPAVRVLILSMHNDKGLVSRGLKAGAKGYVLKDRASEELVRAIRTVADNEVYLCQRVMAVVLEDYTRRIADASPPHEVTLTPREREILQLMAEGHNAKSVAFLLNINVKTVDTHRQQIMKKLNLHSVAELTAYAIREGLTSLES